jgi:hypothetical protein
MTPKVQDGKSSIKPHRNITKKPNKVSLPENLKGAPRGALFFWKSEGYHEYNKFFNITDRRHHNLIVINSCFLSIILASPNGQRLLL